MNFQTKQINKSTIQQNKKQKVWHTKDITKAAILASIIIMFGSTFQLWFAGKVVVQFADVVGFLIIMINPALVAISAFLVGMSLVDLLVGAVIYIPITIIICLLMFATIKLSLILSKKWNYSIFIYTGLLFASCCILINILYTWLLYGYAIAQLEMISATSQAISTFIFSCGLYIWIKKISKTSHIIKIYY